MNSWRHRELPNSRGMYWKSPSKSNDFVHTLYRELAAAIKGSANGITILTEGNGFSNGY